LDLAAIVHYCLGGRVWIVDSGYNNTGPEHHSTVELSRDGKPAWGQFEGERGRWGNFRAGTQLAEIVSRKPEKPGEVGPFEVAIAVRDLAGADWVRTLKGGNGKTLEIEDEFSASEAGLFKLAWRLRLLGAVRGKGSDWVVVQKGESLPLSLEITRPDSVSIRPWEPDDHARDGGAYPWYAFLVDEGGARRGRPVTLEWVREIRLTRGQGTRFRAKLGPLARTGY
jgi:hypothetical protein